MAHPVLLPPAARTVIRWQQCVRSITFCNTVVVAVLALATVNEFQRHNRDDEGDEGSPRAKRTLCSRKNEQQRRVLEHSKQLDADRPLEPASRTGHEEISSFQLTFACPTPAYQTPPEGAQKQKQNLPTRSDLTVRKVSRRIPSNK